jgi:diguanylate cyclase (GGDEF)-like protein
MRLTQPAAADASDARPLRSWAQGGAWVLVAVGGVVLLGGWAIGIEPLTNIVPGTVQMKVLTAIALVFSGASLLLLIDAAPTGRRRMIGTLCAVVPVIIGCLVIVEYLLGWNSGLDELPFTDAAGRADQVTHPGRPAPTTAANLVLVGVALLTLDAWPRSRWRVSELLAIPVMVVATASLIGYLYAIPEFYGPASAAKMALHTAACFLVIGISLAIARPRGRLLDLATTTAPGGTMARRLIPFVLLMPLLLGWLSLKLGDAGLFGDRVGTWWLTAATIAIFLFVLGRAAARMNTLDTSRLELEVELFRLANHDQQTGLFNRHRFGEELGRHADRTRRMTASTALILLDLDRLKEINDGLGHEAGDVLIEGVGKAIGSRARVTDIAARIGGDEFAVLLPGGTLDGAMQAAGDLLVAIREVLPPGAGTMGSSAASVGVAFTESAVSDAGEELLAQADAAMYDAKRSGGDCIAAFAPASKGDTALYLQSPIESVTT